MHAFSMAENSALATESLSGSRRQALAKTGGPGCVRRWWRIWWQGGEAVKPLEERTSGKSKRRLEIHFGMERKVALREEDGGGKDARHKEGEELLKNLLIDHVQKNIVMAEKIRSEDWNGNWSQLKRPLKIAGTKK